MQKRAELQKKITYLARNDKRFKNCHAITENGYSCRGKAMSGEVFCHAHLLQGYGLFTLAVLAELEVKLDAGGLQHDRE